MASVTGFSGLVRLRRHPMKILTISSSLILTTPSLVVWKKANAGPTRSRSRSLNQRIDFSAEPLYF
ncbi:predicted protein [Arabidopsis lyrata subsp. lyrata]|uniref:Predicted protein n=1 Tax=Arabidopsis lyrata subsp. lyrata TaxID=81972 RepID=D7KQR1_ARALL|nr:predicted protein [Arabidopsis lyrata subsp. lyrata]